MSGAIPQLPPNEARAHGALFPNFGNGAISTSLWRKKFGTAGVGCEFAVESPVFVFGWCCQRVKLASFADVSSGG